MNFFDEYKSKSKALNAELHAVFKKHGFKVTKLNAAIGEGDVRLSIGLSANEVKGDDGSATTPEALRFKRYAEMYGLKPDDLGKTVTLRTSTYTITGLRVTRGDKNVVLERDGKTFFGSAKQVRAILHPEGKPLAELIGTF